MLKIRTYTAQESRILVKEALEKFEKRFVLKNFFADTVQSKDDTISLEMLPKRARGLAPRIHPRLPGSPVRGAGKSIQSFTPTYLKFNTPIEPGGVYQSHGETNKLLVEDYDDPMRAHIRERVRITEEHIERIVDTWEWMAMDALVNGKVDVSYEGHPVAEINFGRDASLTKTLTDGSFWGQDGVSIIAHLNAWRAEMWDAPYGMGGNILLAGSKAAAAIRADKELRELMDKRFNPDGTNLTNGLVENGHYVKVGTISGLCDVYEVNANFVDTDKAGEPVSLKPLAANEICLVAKDYGGVKGFGRIKDLAAQYAATPLFGRNFVTEGDPQVESVVHQSAPIMIPTQPNRSLKATVLAE